MQTFMPHDNYFESGQALDDKRLGKQRVEAYQILKALRGHYDNTGAWVNHPATRMWAGYETELATYGQVICLEWQRRGFDDSLLPMFQFNRSYDDSKKPWWVNDTLLHLTHQSNLVRKNGDYYLWDVPSNLPYVWPLLDDHEAFRLGTLKLGDDVTHLKSGYIFVTLQQIAELYDRSPREFRLSWYYKYLPTPCRHIGKTAVWHLAMLYEVMPDMPTKPFGGRRV